MLRPCSCRISTRLLFSGFGKDRETHVHWEWCFSVFGVSVCCCYLFVSGIAVILQQLGNGLVRLWSPNLSCDLISAPCSTIPTNWRRMGGIASLTQASGNVPSNLEWWSSMCRLKIFAALAITSASEYSDAFDSDKATSFWNAKSTPLPFLWASSSGISANNLSFNLVVLTVGVSTASCARRCWYNW